MTGDLSQAGGGQSPAVDASVPHAPRIWNYWLGGNAVLFPAG